MTTVPTGSKHHEAQGDFGLTPNLTWQRHTERTEYTQLFNTQRKCDVPQDIISLMVESAMETFQLSEGLILNGWESLNKSEEFLK